MRSLLFVPGNAPDKFPKAAASAAGALILDLEDSVPLAGKAQARQAVAEFLRAAARDKPLWVRVNSLGTGLMLEDLAAVIPAKPFGIVVPKCEGQATLGPLGHYLDALECAAGLPARSTRILAIATETARSLFKLQDYTDETGRLWGLAWGGEDLRADTGSIENRVGADYTEPYRMARSLCLFGAAAAGVRAIDAVSVAINDTELVAREAAEAFRDGFSGKMAIHPAQLAPIHASMTPSEQQVEWSRRVIAAFEQNPSQGALRLNGQLIDEPHLKLARRLLGPQHA